MARTNTEQHSIRKAELGFLESTSELKKRVEHHLSMSESAASALEKLKVWMKAESIDDVIKLSIGMMLRIFDPNTHHLNVVLKDGTCFKISKSELIEAYRNKVGRCEKVDLSQESFPKKHKRVRLPK